MSRRAGAIPLGLLVGAAILAACTEIPSGADDLLSFEFSPLPSTAVVVGDTLRDSTGLVTPIKVIGFSYNGDTIAAPQVTFRAVDAGIRVDSVTGVVVGDSVRTGARILAVLKGFEGTVTLGVAYRPDSAIAVNARDSISYPLADTAGIVSAAMGLKLIHRLPTVDTAVVTYPVSFRIVSGTAGLARLVNDNGSISSTADTTDVTGTATRKLRIDPTKLSSLVDSVIVEAVAKYRGTNVKGSPVRLVLKLKPK